ncbi:MAG: potassium channel family protein [Pseudomonadota bacterium]
MMDAEGHKPGRTVMQRLKHHLYSHFYIKMTVVMLVSILIFPAIHKIHAGVAAIVMVDVVMMMMTMQMVTFASRQRHLRRMMLIFCGVGAITFDIYTTLNPNNFSIVVSSAFFCVFYAYAIYSMLRYVLLPGRITLDRLFASLTAYMTMALFWALIYRMLYVFDPSAFRFDSSIQRSEVPFFDFIYFSYATITTTGYGDIVPNTHQVQSFAIVEQMVGVLYVAILVARLTNLYSTANETQD